jgi:hypothetical protein
VLASPAASPAIPAERFHSRMFSIHFQHLAGTSIYTVFAADTLACIDLKICFIFNSHALLHNYDNFAICAAFILGKNGFLHILKWIKRLDGTPCREGFWWPAWEANRENFLLIL